MLGRRLVHHPPTAAVVVAGEVLGGMNVWLLKVYAFWRQPSAAGGLRPSSNMRAADSQGER